MTTQVLLLGFDPTTVLGMDPRQVAPAFEHARARAAEEGVHLVECLVAPDESAVADIVAALSERVWDCVVVGGGIRKPEAALEFFELVLNAVHRRASDSAIAFNSTPADSVEAAQRAIGIWKSVT